MVCNNSIIGVDTQFPLNIRSRVGGMRHFDPTRQSEFQVLKILKIWIYVQRITPTKIYFVLVRPVVPDEITDGMNLAILFPRDLLQERDNVQLRVVNYILYGNGKDTPGISDTNTNTQLVCTCLVLNWNQGKKSSLSGRLVLPLLKYEQIIRLTKAYLATLGATVHGHYREIIYEGIP
ncbi:DNA-directed RNA polymerase subunit beta'' [Bienertia sinuspersici]